MGWVFALITIAELVLLGFILSRPKAEEDWRDAAEALRERLKRDGVPRA